MRRSLLEIQSRAGLKLYRLASSDVHLLACLRIDAGTSGTLCGVEGSEADDGHSLVLLHLLCNDVTESCDSLLGISLGHLTLLGYCLNEFGLVHDKMVLIVNMYKDYVCLCEKVADR